MMKLKQLQHESNSWKRLLAFMMDENIHLKNRLSEVLKDEFNINLLEQLEYFQTKFIKEDELIRLLRNDIVELDRLLLGKMLENRKTNNNMDKKLDKLRKSIMKVESQFGALKSEFNNYLSINIEII